jgi:uncharacterized protein with GYD domain
MFFILHGLCEQSMISSPDVGVRRVSGRVLMKTLYMVAPIAQAKLKAYTGSVLLLLLGLVLLPTGEAVGQQAGPTFHRYLVRAVLTAEGLKNLQKQPPTALKAGVAKFVESVGGKLEFWYFDYGAATAYSVIDYPDEVAAATAQLSTNAAGFARVTIRPLLTAEEMDKAVAKWPPVRVPQQQ